MRLPGILLFALASAICAPAAAAVTAGPFQVETVEKSIGAGGFPNTSANPFARTKVTVFRVSHRGKRVAAQDGGQRQEEFWEAKVLADAPRPAVLLAGTGVYLVTEEQGQPRVTVLAPATTDMAHWQWLDGPDGQPMPEAAVGLRHAGSEDRSERGGRLLWINRQVLLDVATLVARPMMAYTSENVAAAGGYNASGEPAKALSPQRTQHVLVGTRQAGMQYEYALVVMDHASGRAYGVPFDRNALRFESVWDATPEWLGRNFEWTRQPGGKELLRVRSGIKAAPHVGRLVRASGGRVEYTMAPTGAGMMGALHEFVVAHFGAVSGASASRLPEGTDSKALLVEGRALRIYHDADRRTTSLYAESGGAPAYALVEKVGGRFNEELQQGRHQGHFTEYAR